MIDEKHDQWQDLIAESSKLRQRLLSATQNITDFAALLQETINDLEEEGGHDGESE